MTVSQETPSIQYTADGSTQTYAAGFTILQQEDLAVYLDGVLQTSGYTVSGIGTPLAATVTFTSAPASGTAVDLVRTVVLDRETDYQAAGDFRAQTVNADFDQLWYALQDFRRQLNSRVLQFAEPSTRSASTNQLPAPEAGKRLQWEVDGSLVNVAPDVQITAGDLPQIDSLAAGMAADLAAHDLVFCRSYYASWAGTAAGPLGAALYFRNGTTGTAGTLFTSRAGFYDVNGDGFALAPGQRITPEQFGAKATTTNGTDGDDDGAALQAAIDYLESIGGGLLHLAAGERYRSDSTLTIAAQNVGIVGDGGPGVPVIYINADTVGIDLQAARIVLRDFSLRSTLSGAGSATSHGVYASASAPYLDLCNFKVQDFPGNGAYFPQTYVSKFNNCEFQGNGLFGFRVDDGTSLDMSTTYALNNSGGGYHIERVAYMTGNSLAADGNSGGPAYKFKECYCCVLNALGLEGNAHDNVEGLVSIAGCRTMKFSGIFFAQNTGGGGSDGNALLSTSDTGSIEVDNIQISGVRLHSTGSPLTQYVYDFNGARNGAVTLDSSEQTTTVNRTNGLATMSRRGSVDLWNSVSGGAHVLKFDLDNENFLFGEDAANNGTVDSAGGIGLKVDGNGVNYRRDTSAGSSVARFMGAVSGGGETRCTDLGATFNTTGTYGTISDRRRKENIEYQSDEWRQAQLDDLSALQLAKYNLVGQDAELLGLIAQDVQAICPGLVAALRDDDSDDETLVIKTSVLTFKMLAAIQELTLRVQQLEAEKGND